MPEPLDLFPFNECRETCEHAAGFHVRDREAYRVLMRAAEDIPPNLGLVIYDERQQSFTAAPDFHSSEPPTHLGVLECQTGTHVPKGYLAWVTTHGMSLRFFKFSHDPDAIGTRFWLG